VAVLVDGKLLAHLLVQLDHGAGERGDARLVAPDRVTGQLVLQHWHQIRAVDDLQLIM